MRFYQIPLVIFLIASNFLFSAALPHLKNQGSAVQLIVDDRPFLILGGELGNSTASSLNYMKSIWPKLVQLNLNTALIPVYWDLIEPREGTFDFMLIDGLLEQARQNNLRLILLWFGSWKNSMSCYAPGWVKTNPDRFPRARLKNGQPMEIMSAFSKENCDADARAFASLMRYLRQSDSHKHTVIMVQVENEVGMLSDARDWSPAANQAFSGPVPTELIDYLTEKKETLIPEFHARWAKKGFKTVGTWEEVFGKGLPTDEIFMAWHYGRYVQAVAAAGKAEYPLPMFVNAALIRPGYKPGQYPSAGPLPHLMDIWRAAAPAIDFLSPDIYFPNFAYWCRQYHQSANPLFIPEAQKGPDSAAQALYAIGQHNSMGYSPFSIENIENPANAPLANCYGLLRQLSHLILRSQGTFMSAGVLLDKQNPIQEIKLGRYNLTVSHDYTWGWSGGDPKAPSWPKAGGILLIQGPDEYLIAGTGLIITFASQCPGQTASIQWIQEGNYDEEESWVPGRWLSGDESHQGRHLRIPMGQFAIQRIRLYQYK